MNRRHRSGVLVASVVAIAFLLTAAIIGCGEKAQNVTAEAAAQKTIPQLAGLTEQNARAALEAAGWSFQVEYLPGPDDQVGTVLSQQPASGELGSEEQLVVLVVGAKQQVEIPAEDQGGYAPSDTPSDSGSGSTPESTWVTCPFCGGTGHLAGSTTPCGVCLGTGQVR